MVRHYPTNDSMVRHYLKNDSMVRHYPIVDSTNDEARRLYEGGQRTNVWIHADSQSAGRGRRGRSWVSVPGNLFATGLYCLPLNSQQAGQMAFVAALAVAQSLSHFLPDNSSQQAIILKWPNDILVYGGKCCGILIENLGAPATGHMALAIGVGVNLVGAPDDVGQKVMSLKEALAKGGQAAEITPEAFLPILIEKFEYYLAMFLNPAQGFSSIRTAWLAKTRPIGADMVVNLSHEQFSGKFAGLADDGALILAMANGQNRLVHAGEVFFGGPNSENMVQPAQDMDGAP